MDIVITHWELESRIDLIHKHVFTEGEYHDFCEDIELLKDYPHNEKFRVSKFWGRATVNGNWIKDGYKMKWHNIGSGRVQLRLAVALIDRRAFLCSWYVKRDEKVDKKEVLKLKAKIQKIHENNFVEREVI